MQTPDIANNAILIASCSVDAPTWEPVANNLAGRGYDIVLFEADKVALREVPFEITVRNEGMEVFYDSERFCLNAIHAAWFRRPSFITNPREDGIAQMSLDTERRVLQSSLWDEIDDQQWLNSPERIRMAEKNCPN